MTKTNSANWSSSIQKHSGSLSHSLILSQGWHFDLCTSVDRIKQLDSFSSLCYAITPLSHPLLKHLTTQTETAMIDLERQSVLHKPQLSVLFSVSFRGHTVTWPPDTLMHCLVNGDRKVRLETTSKGTLYVLSRFVFVLLFSQRFYFTTHTCTDTAMGCTGGYFRKLVYRLRVETWTLVWASFLF